MRFLCYLCLLLFKKPKNPKLFLSNLLLSIPLWLIQPNQESLKVCDFPDIFNYDPSYLHTFL